MEEMARSHFDSLKDPKTDTVSLKRLKNWEGIKAVIDSGELSKGALKSAIKKVIMYMSIYVYMYVFVFGVYIHVNL
jgi:hypothetical protein